ncbi:hypothetical protein CEUSTIGMA_g5553.t1 [Chlamydomonas eustigma]|uniref:Pherophorin domain-containing protein n=1 Tax=Chlamydomonas eustigma TaxID=1157962 RepID=A0A250X4W6_9CHLO|nr:hypothetical protein CEUSTIGMA_g5553.t1 [Chlamydomonas eustigma]|eukprot:GAX78111.1 hypothetical protein CEUSTIGMA_g5553.t1 [Chlamydomonas eustigma]
MRTDYCKSLYFACLFALTSIRAAGLQPTPVGPSPEGYPNPPNPGPPPPLSHPHAPFPPPFPLPKPLPPSNPYPLYPQPELKLQCLNTSSEYVSSSSTIRVYTSVPSASNAFQSCWVIFVEGDVPAVTVTSFGIFSVSATLSGVFLTGVEGYCEDGLTEIVAVAKAELFIRGANVANASCCNYTFCNNASSNPVTITFSSGSNRASPLGLLLAWQNKLLMLASKVSPHVLIRFSNMRGPMGIYSPGDTVTLLFSWHCSLLYCAMYAVSIVLLHSQM